MLKGRDLLLAVKKGGKVDKTLLQKPLHTVSHAVKRFDRALGHVLLHTADNTRERRIDSGGGTAGLSYNGVAV